MLPTYRLKLSLVLVHIPQLGTLQNNVTFRFKGHIFREAFPEHLAKSWSRLKSCTRTHTHTVQVSPYYVILSFWQIFQKVDSWSFPPLFHLWRQYLSPARLVTTVFPPSHPPYPVQRLLQSSLLQNLSWLDDDYARVMYSDWLLNSQVEF